MSDPQSNWIRRELFRIPRRLIGDFLVHNTMLYHIANTTSMDSFWYATNGSFLPWLLGNKDSSFIIRQGLAAATNSQRFVVTSSISAIDATLSYLISGLGICSDVSEKNVKKRCFKRLMLTCHQNGGIYEEIQQLVKTLNQDTPYLIKLANKPPLIDEKVKFLGDFNEEYALQNAIEDVKNLNIFETRISLEDTVNKILQKEFKQDINDIFHTFSFVPTKVRNGTVCFDGALKSGQPVSVTVHLPLNERMQFLDMIPLALSRLLVGVIPFTAPERGLLNAIQRRVCFSIKKEVTARQELLRRLGVDLAKDAESIAASVDSLRFPILVPAPLPGLVSRHVMVTTPVPSQTPTVMAREWATRLVDATTASAFRHSLLLGDVSLANLRVSSGGRISLDRFHTLCQLSPQEASGLAHCLAALAGREEHTKRAAEALRVREKAVRGAVEGLRARARPLLSAHAPAVLAAAENLSGLIGHARCTGLRGSEAFGDFACAVALKAGDDAAIPSLKEMFEKLAAIKPG